MAPQRGKIAPSRHPQAHVLGQQFCAGQRFARLASLDPGTCSCWAQQLQPFERRLFRD